MATLDVPGSNPVNEDELSIGSWAEHTDGSLIYVKEITKADFVVFDVYDLSEKSDPVFYTDLMPIEKFNQVFSFAPDRPTEGQIKWLWHDKTQFPWMRVLHATNRSRRLDKNTIVTKSAAARVAESLKIALAGILTPKYIKSLQDGEASYTPKTSQTIFNRIRRAINTLRD